MVLLDDYHIEFYSTVLHCYLTDIIKNITENQGNKYYKINSFSKKILNYVYDVFRYFS